MTLSFAFSFFISTTTKSPFGNNKLGSENVKQFVDRIKDCVEFRALMRDLAVKLEKLVEYVSVSSERMKDKV